MIQSDCFCKTEGKGETDNWVIPSLGEGGRVTLWAEITKPRSKECSREKKKNIPFCSCCISTDKTVRGRFPRNVLRVITRREETLKRMLFPGRHTPQLDDERMAMSRQGRWAAWGKVLVPGGQVKEEQVFRSRESGTKASVNAGEI